MVSRIAISWSMAVKSEVSTRAERVGRIIPALPTARNVKFGVTAGLNSPGAIAFPILPSPVSSTPKRIPAGIGITTTRITRE